MDYDNRNYSLSLLNHLSGHSLSTASSALVGAKDTDTIREPEVVLRRRTNVEKWKELKSYFYDRKSGFILGKSPTDLARSYIFSAIFLLCLNVFFLAIFSLYLVSVDDITPREKLMTAPTKANPGLAIRPVADFETPLIRFVQGREATYTPHVSHVQTFLDQYENHLQEGENFINCDKIGDDEVKPPQKVCRFDPFTLAGECQVQTTFGFEDGRPCILLKLNRLFAWTPRPYAPEDGHLVPPEVRAQLDGRHIPLSCHGEGPLDIENIGNVTFYPADGFPAVFYPFLNQEGFRSPLVFAKFENPQNGIVINVNCKAWARNIRHDLNDQQGMVRFSLLID